MCNDIQIAIIAGGFATRLGDITIKQPKSLIKIAGKSFIEHQIEFLVKSGVQDIVLCLGHLGKMIEDHVGNGNRFGIPIRYSYEDCPLGTAGALKNAAALLNDPFITLYGDSYVFLNFRHVMRFFQSQNKLALMTVYYNKNLYDRSNTDINGPLVHHYSKTKTTENVRYIDYGVNIFRKEVLQLVPEGQSCDLEEIFKGLIREKELLAYEVNDRFYEIGSMQGIQDFTEFVERRQ